MAFNQVYFVGHLSAALESMDKQSQEYVELKATKDRFFKMAERGECSLVQRRVGPGEFEYIAQFSHERKNA